ncbi:MAG: DUF1648 domain-containing protein [Chthoniobacterales bacterium]|nr:DUF1648 domain-containing protein [Chthoniobacterales bacterium]
MRTVSVVILLACSILFAGAVASGHRELPETIATHFDGNGKADGWTGRTSFTVCSLAMGFGVPVFVIGIMYAVRFFPAKYLNVPNPDYWRSPENYRRACDFLFVSSLWFGSAFMLWQVLFLRLIVEANRASPPHLDGGKVVLFTVPLLAFTFGWAVVLILRFLKTDGTGGGNVS